MVNVIHKEFCQKLNFDRANEWYMYKAELVSEKDTYKIIWYF